MWALLSAVTLEGEIVIFPATWLVGGGKQMQGGNFFLFKTC